MVPAVYIQPVNETNIPNPMFETNISAFDLFPSFHFDNIVEPVVNNQNKFNATPITHDNENKTRFSVSTAQEFNSFDDFSDIYYAIEDYVDEVGDGVNLKRGVKVIVSSSFFKLK